MGVTSGFSLWPQGDINMQALNSIERTKKLIDAMGFTEEELAENRAGRLSPRQMENLKSMPATTTGYPVMTLVGGVLLCALGCGMFIVFLTQLSNAGDALMVMPIVSIPVFLFLGFGGYQIYRYWRFQQARSGKAPIQKYSGKVKLVIVNYGYTVAGMVSSAAGYDPRQYKLQIGLFTTFYPPPPVFSAFQNGQKYAIYATPTLYYPQIVSAEGID